MLNVAILVITCLTNLLLGGLVLARNPRSPSGRAFFVMSCSITAWVVSNYLTGVDSLGLSWNNVFNRLAYFFAFLAIAFGLRFTVNFIRPSYLGFGRGLDKFLAFLGVAVALLSLTPLIAGEVSDQAGRLEFSFGPAIVIYVLTYLLFLGLNVYALRKIMRIKQGHERQQALYILIGFSVTALLGLLTNVLLPSVTSSWESTALGPVFTVLLVSTIAYAIVRHKLFDIRLVVVRSLTYALSIAAVVGAYSLIAFGLLNTVFDFNISAKEEIVMAAFSALTALFFQPVKRFFDRNTSRLFYQDSYNAEDFFDQLNKVIVSTIELDELLEKATQVIAANMKASYCAIGVKDGSKAEYRVVGTSAKQFSAADVAVVRKITPKMHQGVILTDYLDEHNKTLREILSSNEIAAIARLAVDYRSAEEGMGYIILGNKRSGNPYTDQDSRILDTASNELLVAIQNCLRFEEIERFNETLQQRVEDATYKLRQSNKKLKQMDQTKDDFISMTSHQLRTPLTTIKGYVSLVVDGDAGQINETQRKLLNQAFTSAQKMVFLVADLLNVSRLKTGKFVIERVPSNLSEVVSGEIEQLKEEASGRNLTMEYVPPKNFPILPLDETKTRQVIMNFLDNAIYYTPQGGKITAELKELPESVEFRVVDNGIGVPRADRHQLFTKFYRAKNAQRARPDGTGLGLYMASKVVIAQGGAIIFNSKEGQGSTFGFSFPKKMPEGQVPFPAHSHD